MICKKCGVLLLRTENWTQVCDCVNKKELAVNYLEGKQVMHIDLGTIGIVISAVFREPWRFDCDNTPLEWKTCVAVAWEGGGMEGAVDIELLELYTKPQKVPMTWEEYFNFRVANVLYRNNIETLEQLKALSDTQLLKMRNMGRKGLREIHEQIKEWG